MKKNKNFSKKQEDIPPQDLNDNILVKMTNDKYYDKVTKSLLCILILSMLFYSVPILIHFLALGKTSNFVYSIILLSIFSVFFFANIKTKSNFIRSVTLFLILFIVILLSTNNMTTIENFLYVLILISIIIFNFYTQIKNYNYLIWCSILNSLCIGVFLYLFLNVITVGVYILFSIILNGLICIIVYKNTFNNYKYIIVFLINAYIIEKFIINTEGIFGQLIATIITIAILIFFYYLIKEDKLKVSFYISILYTSIGFLYITYNNDIYFNVILCILACISLFSIFKFNNIIVNIVSGCFLWMGACILIINDYILINVVFLSILACIIWYLSKDNKNNKFIVFCKHTIFSILTFTVIDSVPFDLKYSIYLGVIISIIYVLISTNLERLKHDRHKHSNKFILILFLIISTIYSIIGVENLIASFILNTLIILLLTNSKYTNDGFIKKHMLLIGSLYFTYIIHSFCIMIIPDYAVAYLIANILLIIFAYVLILKGYKIKDNKIKYYGLILLVIILYRLLFISLCYYKLSIKLILLCVILIPLLIISVKKIILKNKSNKIDLIEDISGNDNNSLD